MYRGVIGRASGDGDGKGQGDILIPGRNLGDLGVLIDVSEGENGDAANGWSLVHAFNGEGRPRSAPHTEGRSRGPLRAHLRFV